MAPTFTLASAAPNPAVFGQPVTLTATVIPLGLGTPTGTVTFVVAGGPTLTAPLVGGTATVTTTGIPIGFHTFTANYNGSPQFSPSSGFGSVTITTASTSTVVTSSPDPSNFGQPVAITATVAPVAPGAGTPTGTVTFVIGGGGGGTLTAPLVGGTATVTTSSLTPGTHLITATYGGNAQFNASSGTDTQTVQQVLTPTTTTVTSFPDPSVFGQPVTFTATVAPVPPGSGIPTGTVTFVISGTGGGTLTAPLVGGTASVTTSSLGVGPHTVTATYSGSGSFAPSSGTDTQTVNKASTTTTVISAPDPSAVGQPVTFTATVAPVAPGAGTPTGTVTFFISGGPTLTGTLSGGTASVSTSALAAGTHTVTAIYSGDANFNSSVGTDTHTVGQASTTTTVTSSPDPSVVGQSVTFTATVAPVAPGAGTPTGTVTFVISGGPTLTGTLSGGTASVTTSALSVGTHTVTATYSGDASFTSSVGTDTQTVNKASTTTTVSSS
ncbi:Ig-like domain-containing protein, partial [Streptomyces glebosus]